ncbi:MAG: molybdopterin biosynthesis protein, partial [Candidatus Kariarchaeum pelagius]
MDRKIFRNLLDPNEARNKFYDHINFDTKSEIISIDQALGRVSVKEIYSPINVPPFDRAAMDGFAVLASDTKGAEENKPVELQIVGKLKAGYSFEKVVHTGESVEISTGAPMPSGTNSVVMVEYSETTEEEKVKLSRSVTPNENTMAAGADIQLGDRILAANRILTSRELALIASIGLSKIEVYKKPKIAVYSSGDEIILPGKELKLGKLYDINSTAVISMLNENGGDPHFEGVLIDKKEDIKNNIVNSLDNYDMIIVSGGTSAGMGDVLYQVIDEIGPPGLLVHGIKVKPGKPTILGVCNNVPIIGLPGYPASAISIMQLLVIPLTRKLSGLPDIDPSSIIKATIKQRLRSSEGRYEFKPMYLFRGLNNWIAYPVPGGSGAITSVSLADGFIQIPENTHYIPANTDVEIHLISQQIKPPSLQIVGSNDFALNHLQSIFEKLYSNLSIRLIGLGSYAGLAAVRRGEAHLAGVHILQHETYNSWIKNEFPDISIIPGYFRIQGLIVKKGNPKNIQRIPKNSKKFQKIPKNSKKF